jgi:O-antigen biosynthesis protein
VVVSTRDRLRPLQACLESVYAQHPTVLEAIVVDSAPRLAEASAIAGRFGAYYARLARPGLSRARNHGARLAQGEVVVFLDDDVMLEPGCLAALLAEFSDPLVAAAGGRIVLAGGDDTAREAFEAMGGFDPGLQRRVVERGTPGWFELVNFGGLGSGAMLAVRRSVFATWAGFDERLGRGAALDAGEEMHAYFSLVERGHRVVYTPAAVARHPAPGSLRELRHRMLNGAATGAAYLTLLLVEHPGYRAAVVRYAGEALRGRRREWRPPSPEGGTPAVSRWRLRAAWLQGPWLYARMRWRARRAAPYE